MKMMITLCLISLVSRVVVGQINLLTAPEIGKPCPAFIMNHINNYSQKEISLSELSGKYVILDFWSIGCTACIEGFRKMNPIQRKYKKDLQFFLIGKDHFGQKPDSELAKITFNKYKERWDLELPACYDANLFEKFKVPFVPYCVWIGPDGIVRALTSSGELNETNIDAFLNGREIVMVNRLLETVVTPSIKFDYHQPLLINGNGGNDSEFLFRSVLSSWNIDTPCYFQPFISSITTNSNGRNYWSGVEPNRVQVNGVSLPQLIELAYGDTVNHAPAFFESRDLESEKYFERSSYGKFWSRPILETRDSTDFIVDWTNGKNLYSYSLIVPRAKASAAYLQRVMQKDVFSYFGYDISVETRSMPCWYLTATDEARLKLKTKGGRLSMLNEPAEMRLRNAPLYQLIRHIYEFNDAQPPIIDRTGITGHVDLEIHAAMMDFEDVRSALRNYGLTFEPGWQEMKVIVVRDMRQ